MTGKISLIEGDITRLAVDGIVNAANASLLGGGGVDGAIHRAAGPKLVAECRSLGGCPPGQARITGGYQLPARYVIHTVGPIWQGGDAGEEEILANCYRNCFALADQYRMASIAFPAIATGAYGFPHQLAATIAVGEAQQAASALANLEKIYFVCFGQETIDAYGRALGG